MQEIEGYFIDRQGQPIGDCRVEVVAWEGEVLAATNEPSDHFVLRIPHAPPNTPVYFRIHTVTNRALNTHHEIDSPGLILPATEQKIRLLRAAAANTLDPQPSGPKRPAWVILQMPEKMVRRVG